MSNHHHTFKENAKRTRAINECECGAKLCGLRNKLHVPCNLEKGHEGLCMNTKLSKTEVWKKSECPKKSKMVKIVEEDSSAL